MASGIPSVLSAAASAANTALDSGIVPVHRTTGAITLVLSASAISAGTFTVTDDLGNILFAGSFAAVTQAALVLGDVEGTSVVLTWVVGALPALGPSSLNALPGGEKSNRPLGLRVQIQALGVGITSSYAIVGEVAGN